MVKRRVRTGENGIEWVSAHETGAQCRRLKQIEIEDLAITDAADDKFWSHGLTAKQVRSVLNRRWVAIGSRPERAAWRFRLSPPMIDAYGDRSPLGAVKQVKPRSCGDGEAP
jgi:hypothetical protein